MLCKVDELLIFVSVFSKFFLIFWDEVVIKTMGEGKKKVENDVV